MIKILLSGGLSDSPVCILKWISRYGFLQNAAGHSWKTTKRLTALGLLSYILVVGPRHCTYRALKGPPLDRVYRFVNVQWRLLTKPLRADVALERLLSGVRPVVDVQVRLPGELGRTLLANVRFQLDCRWGGEENKRSCDQFKSSQLSGGDKWGEWGHSNSMAIESSSSSLSINLQGNTELEV